MLRNILAAMAAILLLSLAACREEGPDERQATVYNIVELADSAAMPVFHLYGPDAPANQPAVLACSREMPLPEGLKVGQCLYLAYVPSDPTPNVSTVIDPVGYTPITNRPLLKAPMDSLAGWDADPVFVTSLWPAGNNLLLRCSLAYDTQARQFDLVVDKATLADSVPVAYLYHRRQNDLPTFDRQYYAAFFLGNLWKRDYVSGLKINMRNSNLPSLQSVIIENPRLKQ